MMPPTDRIREQNEQDPGRVTHTRQEAGPNDFLAVDPALCSLHLNVEGLGSQAFHHPGHSRETQCRPHLPSCRHSAQQQTHHSGMRQVNDGTNRQTYRCPTVSQTLLHMQSVVLMLRHSAAKVHICLPFGVFVFLYISS